MHRHLLFSRHVATAGLIAAVLVINPAPAAAQTAAVLYERTLAREQAAPAASAPVADLRAVARSYEGIVRRYPTSGYADNALWQAAGLFDAVYQRTGDRDDLEKAIELLRWLRREYPSSSLVRQSADRIAALQATAPAPADGPPSAAVVAGPGAGTGTASSAVTTGGASVREITHTSLPRGDRITIEVSREVAFTAERIEGPDRVFFDFQNASAAAALADRAQALGGRLIKTVRLGQPVAGVTRVVLELTGSPRHSSFPLYEPFRLVVDLETDAALPPPVSPAPVAPADASQTAPRESAPPPDFPAASVVRTIPAAAVPPATPPVAAPVAAPPAPAAATSAGAYSIARQLGLGISRVVIDPGHGGHDPGAIANGVREAELVLDISQRLEKLLKQKPGFDVVLTRRTNEFIPLEERTAIANREDADLFLSIHANAGRNTTARGIETYFLNFATNPDAEAVAARENATTGQTMGTLPAILKAIALNNKLAESRELATILQTSMVRRLRTQNKSVRDLGVKQAPFVVLIGAQMPSVLAEISFVTNRAEAALLKQAAYRQQIAQALCDAIVRYQGSLKKITTTPAGLEAR